MKKTFVVSGESVFGADPVDTGDAFVFSDLVMPKRLLTGYQLVQADVPDGYQPGRYTWDGAKLVEIPTPDSASETQTRHITQLAFLNRFSDLEAIQIDLASQGATVSAATMRRYQAKVNAAKFIDLDYADTRAGVQQLEAAGLLGTGRAQQILDAPVLPGEVP